MKTSLFFIMLLLTIVSFLPISSAQDYTTWSLPEGAVARLGKGTITGNIAFSPDGTRLAVASFIGIWIYDARPGREIEVDLFTSHSKKVNVIAFSPDGATIASGDMDGIIRLYDVVTGQLKFTLDAQTVAIISIAFFPDGNTLASGNGEIFDINKIEPEIRLWNTRSGEHISTFKRTY